MQIVGTKLSLEDFKKYVASYAFGSIKPTSLVVHHTWSPTKAQWQGAKSVQGLKTYYEGKGWSAGPHLFVSEDGIWLFTPMKDVGIHAGEGNATWLTPLGRKTQGFVKPLGGRLLDYSIGIEVVGDYDAEKWSGETYKNAVGAIKCLMETLKLSTEGVLFHRDWPSAKKSCPGWAITKEWLGQQLFPPAPVAKLPTGKLIQVAGKPAIYAWTGQKRFQVPDMPTLNFLFPGVTVEAVSEAALASMPDGGPITSLFP